MMKMMAQRRRLRDCSRFIGLRAAAASNSHEWEKKRKPLLMSRRRRATTSEMDSSNNKELAAALPLVFRRVKWEKRTKFLLQF